MQIKVEKGPWLCAWQPVCRYADESSKAIGRIV